MVLGFGEVLEGSRRWILGRRSAGDGHEQRGAVKREQNGWLFLGWLSQVVLVPLGKHISPTNVFYQEGNQSFNFPRQLLCYLEGAWPLREAPQCG